MTPDMDRVERLIREAAAADILPRFKRLAASEVREKQPGDLVTVADLAAERRLTRALQELIPGSLVVGEEAVDQDPTILDNLAGKAPVWIIDPLDGTANFADGKPLFTMMVAFVVRGRTVAAWIHDPLGGETAMAAQGEGVWIGKRRLHVAAAAAPEQMRGAVYARPGRPGITPDLAECKKRLGAAIYRRCVGHEYLALARGETHFGLFTRLWPWDHAAGALIHGEAGGYNACLDGTPYRPTLTAGNFLLAPDAASWRTLRDRFAAD